MLNTATVAVGACIGLLIGDNLQPAYKDIGMNGLGLVTFGIGMKLFLGSKNIIIVAIAIALGGMLGLAIGISTGMDAFADWARSVFGGKDLSTFNEGLITTSILFCVGPMTLLGCIQDGLQGKIELLALKSTMDGIVAVFFAATLGHGVLVTALVVLVLQSALTFMAGALRPIAEDEELVGEISATGGIILLGIALGLLQIKAIRTEDYLPALVLAPILVLVFRRFSQAKQRSVGG